MFDFKPKQLLIALAALVVACFATNFLIHQVLLSADYESTSSVWRAEEDMAKFMPYLMGGQLLTALIFGMLFARGFASGCWPCAIIYGFMMGLFMASHHTIYYAILPVTCGIAIKWAVYSVLQGVLFGVICKLIYGKGPIDESIPM